MQEAKSRTQPLVCKVALPVLALVAFWLPLLPPLIQRGQMTCSHDGMLHLLRALELDTMVRQGILWPRWIPGMVFGYGYPLFNFYPILSLYPVVILHRLGLSLLSGWNLTLALSFLASGLTMYLWARQVLGPRGGFISAVAYMLAPYQLYDAYWRGSLSEILALPLFPLAMWAAWRTAQERRWRYALIGALVYAAILLTHVLSGLMITPVLLTYLLVVAAGSPYRRTALVRFVSFLILGLGLAAFFLAPAYLESASVQLWRSTAPTGLNYRNQFLTLSELLGPAPASDPLLVNPSPPLSLGWATGLSALAGVLITWWRRARQTVILKQHVLWAGLVLVGILTMTLPVSEPIWSRVPLLPFVQFPWRFLGVASLLASLLAGAAIAAMGETDRGGLAAMGVCLVMFAIGALPWAYPRMCPTSDELSQASFTKYERSTGMLGATSSGEYLPAAVSELPTNSPMVRALRTDQPVIRWDAANANVIESRDDGLQAELVLETDTSVQVVYRAFYFPGWQATLDEHPVSLLVIPPLGLMAINVPPGHHTLALRFGHTPLRVFGDLVSLLSVMVVVVLWMRDRRVSLPSRQLDFPAVRPAIWLGLAGLGLAALAFKLLVVDRFDTPFRWRRLQDDRFSAAAERADAVIAASVRLVGYMVHPQPAVAGDVIYADLYWTLDKPFDFRAAVRLIDDHGLEWSDKNELYPARGGYSVPPPSIEWPIGMYADDRHAIQVLPGAPPGVYQIVVVPFRPDTLEPCPVTFGQRAPGDYPGVVIGQLEIRAPSRPPTVDALGLAVRLHTPLGDDMTLVGYSQDRQEASPGQGMSLALGWQARRQPKTDYAARLELVSPNDQVIAQYALPLGGERYPTSQWSSGQIIESQAVVRIPGQAQSGQHRWRVVLLDGRGAQVGLAWLDGLQINAPQRILTAPAVSNRVDVRLGNWATLVGFDAPKSVPIGQSVNVTLVWQAQAETDQDLKVFVHLLAADRRVIAQSDAVPAGWSRPTPGWQAGEYVVDTHSFTVQQDTPPGDYQLEAGMYNPADGTRLLLPDGKDVIDLGRVRVSPQ